MHGFIEHHSYLFAWKNLLKLSLVVLLLVFAVVVSLQFNLDDVQTYIKQNQGQTLIISLLVYVLFGFTFLPSIPLTLFIAILIGPFQAALVATLGNTLAAFFEYQVGKTIGDVVDFEEKKSKLPFGLGKLPVKSPYFLLAIRSIPAGTRSVSVMCGAFHVPMASYLWTTFTMYLISSAFLAYGGSELIKFI